MAGEEKSTLISSVRRLISWREKKLNTRKNNDNHIKLCISPFLDPANFDVNRTQTTNKTLQKYSNDKIQKKF